MRTKKTKLKTQDASQGSTGLYVPDLGTRNSELGTRDPFALQFIPCHLPFPFKVPHSPSLPSPFSPPWHFPQPLHFLRFSPFSPLFTTIQQRVSPATRNMQLATVEGFSVVVLCFIFIFIFIFVCLLHSWSPGPMLNPTHGLGGRKTLFRK